MLTKRTVMRPKMIGYIVPSVNSQLKHGNLVMTHFLGSIVKNNLLVPILLKNIVHREVSHER